MIQLLHFAGYKNILATASTKHHDFLRSLGATNLFDYRNPELTNEIAKAVGQEGKVAIAVDCIATEKTLEQVAQAISPSGTVAVLLPVKKTDDVVVDDKSKFDMNPEGRFSSDVRVLGVGTFTYLIVSPCIRISKSPVIKEETGCIPKGKFDADNITGLLGIRRCQAFPCAPIGPRHFQGPR